VSSLIERTKPSLFLEFEGSISGSRKTVDNLADFRESTAIGSFNREFVRLYRAKESVSHKREGAAYACVR